MFWFKKTFAPLLFPIPVLLLVLTVGVVLLWRGRRPRLARGLLTGVLAALVLLSCAPIAESLIWRLESIYPVFEPAAYEGPPVGWVVVLGGGVVDDPTLPPNSQLGLTTLSRLVEGVRILDHFPEAGLLLSGGGVLTTISEASAMQRVALLFGVDSTRIRLDESSRDTKDQALRVAELLDGEPFVLVTSASHIPRSVALFRKQGLDPIPAPTDFAVRRGTADRRLSYFYPSSQSIKVHRQLMYEVLGMLWARLRGQI